MKVTIDAALDVPADVDSGGLAEMRVGYARVSTAGQLLDRQIHALRGARCSRIFADKLSGRSAERPQLTACLDYLRAGDVLVVPSLDRLSRSLQDLIALVGELRRRGVGFSSLHEALDTTTPGERLVFHVFAALAEFIRELIVQGTKEGLAAPVRADSVWAGRRLSPRNRSSVRASFWSGRRTPCPRSRACWVSPALRSTRTCRLLRQIVVCHKAEDCRTRWKPAPQRVSCPASHCVIWRGHGADSRSAGMGGWRAR